MHRCLASLALSAAFVCMPVPGTTQAQPAPEPPQLTGTLTGTLTGGARWTAEVPPNWNGTLLLWSRGYSARPGDPDLAPPAWKADLLAAGYALAASNYGAGGWALAEAVPAQQATIAAFARTHGQPRRVIAWGQSMGGLITAALAEQPHPPIAGGIALCSSIGGAVGMMNMGLDGAFAFTTLVAPDAGIQLVGVSDDGANARRAQLAVDAAMRTAQGRARIALAGVLGGLPGWTRRDRPQPSADDVEGQVEDMAASFVMGVFMPRVDQESRAGGVFSWNTGVDYAALLRKSGRHSLVTRLYRKAGLDLSADLATLRAAPRVAADPRAVAYMMAHYTPDARPAVPLLAVQAVGDGATSPSLQQAYAAASDSRKVRALWLGTAGHCVMDKATALMALHYLEARLDSGRWAPAPAGTVSHQPAPMLRPCFRNRRCR